MITEMERILNPSWFWRRYAKTDEYCTLSTSQYWDWLTYIDVSVISWPSCAFRMTTWASGRWSRWRRCTSDKHRNFQPRWSLILALRGWLPSPWWDQSSNLLPTDGCYDSHLPWLWDAFSTRMELTGREATKPSTSWWCSLHPMAATCAEIWKRTSQCGGGGPVPRCTTTGTTCPKCTSTTGKQTFQRELISIQRDTEISQRQSLSNYLS